MQDNVNDKQRVLNIDILRGIVMVIMALDHVRDYFHETAMLQDPMDVNTTTPFLYFTRWITHYCAPVFVFLSGISAYLSAGGKSFKVRSANLIKRGLFLVIFEITVITFGWTFNPFFNMMVLQVIWAIGCSMLILGLLSFLRPKAILLIGLFIICAHNLLDSIEASHQGEFGFLWDAAHRGGFSYYPIDTAHGFLIVYPVLPWAGIMMLGYGIGEWYRTGFEPARRRKRFLISGLSAFLGFVLLRFSNLYGNPQNWSAHPDFSKSVMSFLDLSKYPPSLLYTMMTIGPALVFLALSENLMNRFCRWMMVFGRVPMFYYVMHIYLIHILCVMLFYLSGYDAADIVSERSFFYFRPAEMGFGLPILYIIWIGVVIILYFPSKWYFSYKSGRKFWLFRYI